jgi:hypothetical protein
MNGGAGCTVFGAEFTSIEAKAFYPTNNTNPTQPIGQGTLSNVNIPKVNTLFTGVDDGLSREPCSAFEFDDRFSVHVQLYERYRSRRTDHIESYQQGLSCFPWHYGHYVGWKNNRARSHAVQCGIFGTPKQKLTVNLDLTVHVKVVGITIAPSFSTDTSFDCPLTQDDLLKAGLGALGNSKRSLLKGMLPRSLKG